MAPRYSAVLCSCLLIVLLSPRVASAADWPQWRGLYRDGIAAGETGLKKSWPEGGPPLCWRAEGFGVGYSSLAVVGNALFTMGDIDGKQFVIAARRDDGTIIWQVAVGDSHASDNFKGPRCTPTVHAGHVYTLSTDGLLTCIGAANGKLRWQKDLAGDYGGFVARGNNYDWKYSESPLVDGDRVIVTPGSPDALMVALDKTNGREIWRTRQKEMGDAGADGAAYSSIVISQAAGVKQYVTLTGRGAIGVAASSGEHLWGYNRIANKIANVPTPIVTGDYVFVSTGYGTGAALLEITKQRNELAAKEIYFRKRAENHHGGMILSDGHVYFGKGNNLGLPMCVELRSGETKWGPVRNEGQGSAAISFADGHLYMRYQDGLMVLVEADDSRYIEKGTFMIPDVEDRSWSHPVIAGRRLYLREQDKMYCYDLSE